MVPCCVYSKEAGGARRDATTGLRVGTMSYPQFVRYLVAKDPARVRVGTLPFEGKNKVVFSAPEWVGADGDACGECVACDAEGSDVDLS